jgi:hypothetical protein
MLQRVRNMLHFKAGNYCSFKQDPLQSLLGKKPANEVPASLLQVPVSVATSDVWGAAPILPL